ncbi:MAG: acyltransferase [Syntrophobacteraceae bacterium]
MLRFLPDPLRGLVSLLVVVLNTVFCSLLLYVVALLRLVPVDSFRLLCCKVSSAIAQVWVWINKTGLDITKDIRWDVEGVEGLDPKAWYLLVANHQSMIDIVALQSIFHRKIPPLKFFLKQELLYVPVIGIAWWALDFPFMKRSSSARKDIETTRNACEKFRTVPVTIMNFLEGTRFTLAKREEQNSPYTHLLKPRIGGLGVVLSTMGERLDSILDVTIVYPRGVPGLWKFLCSHSVEIRIRVKRIPLTSDLLGDYISDRAYRGRFKDWIHGLWDEKDKLIGTLLLQGSRRPNVEDS